MILECAEKRGRVEALADKIIPVLDAKLSLKSLDFIASVIIDVTINSPDLKSSTPDCHRSHFIAGCDGLFLSCRSKQSVTLLLQWSALGRLGSTLGAQRIALQRKRIRGR
jgi:hypothetical protein